MRGHKGKENEQKPDDAKQGEGKTRACAFCFFVAEKPCFIDVSDRRRHKENGDVEPIGGFSDDTVVGVKNHGDEGKAKQDATELDAPKILPVPKEKGLHDGKEEHRPKEELHMLPGRFVDTREGRDPNRSSRPII